MASLLSHQWLRCNSCTWAHDEQSCNGASCAEGIICHIATAVAGRVHCFHQPRPQSIFFKTLRFPLIAKRCAGDEDSLQLHSLANLFIYRILVVNQRNSKIPKLRYNSKIQYLIRFVIGCAVVVNFRSEIQRNRIFDIWI